MDGDSPRDERRVANALNFESNRVTYEQTEGSIFVTEQWHANGYHLTSCGVLGHRTQRHNHVNVIIGRALRVLGYSVEIKEVVLCDSPIQRGDLIARNWQAAGRSGPGPSSPGPGGPGTPAGPPSWALT